MSAYGQLVSKPHVSLPYLPTYGRTKTGLRVKLTDYETTKHERQLYDILKHAVDEGQSFPFVTMETVEEFRSFFLSHRCFVCLDESGDDDDETVVLGGFYVKPNFPGRCDHSCNGSFVVSEHCRGQGVASFMVPHYLQIARDLDYEASYFNLVFVSNAGSLKLWENFGFEAVGRLPRAGRLKGLGYVDAIQYYYDLTTIPKTKGPDKL